MGRCKSKYGNERGKCHKSSKAIFWKRPGPAGDRGGMYLTEEMEGPKEARMRGLDVKH